MDQAAPLVAICTPVYNGGKYLAETIECVQAQTYPNLVHILLDNGSNDDTPDIIGRYKNCRVPVVAVRNSETLPMIRNWNAAVDLIPSEAKYFRILCADDLIAPDYVQRKVELAERHPSVGIVGCLVHINSEPPFSANWPKDKEVFPGREVLRRYFRSECWIPTGHALIRCDEIHKQRPLFPEHVLVADLAASMDVLMHSDLGFIHADLGMTRMHDDNHSQTIVFPGQIRMCEWLYFVNEYAALIYDEKEARDVVALYRRYYLRQLLKWRLSVGRSIFDKHLTRLAELGVRPRPWQFVDAALDWIMVRVGLRPVWGGYL